MNNNERDALNFIKAQLKSGYLDISEWPEEEEMRIVKEAIEEWEKNHRDDPAIIRTNSGLDVNMRHICGCDLYSSHDTWTLSDCEKYCDRYSSCNNVAIANDILRKHEEGDD